MIGGQLGKASWLELEEQASSHFTLLSPPKFVHQHSSPFLSPFFLSFSSISSTFEPPAYYFSFWGSACCWSELPQLPRATCHRPRASYIVSSATSAWIYTVLVQNQLIRDCFGQIWVSIVVVWHPRVRVLFSLPPPSSKNRQKHPCGELMS